MGPVERNTPVVAISGCLYSIPSGMSSRTRWSLPVAMYFTGSVVVSISLPNATRMPALQVEFELNRNKLGIQHAGNHARQYFIPCVPGFAAHDGQDCVPLL